VHNKITKIIFFAYVALVFYLTLLPQENFNKLGTIKQLEIFLQLESFDKIVHFGLFGLMTLLLFNAYRFFSIGLIIIPFSISLLIEILQGILTFLHRSFDFVDLMANLSGITISYILISIYLDNFENKKRNK